MFCKKRKMWEAEAIRVLDIAERAAAKLTYSYQRHEIEPRRELDRLIEERPRIQELLRGPGEFKTLADA